MTQTETSVPKPATPSGNRPVKGNPWHPTFKGVMLATWIELLRRRPSAKGYIFYGLLFAGILGLGILVAVLSTDDLTSIPFELVLVLVLGAGLLIGPSLSATSINGDSSEGVLAPLQMTRLSAGDLAIGKLLASWAVCIAALLTTIPFLVYAYGRSGWRIDEALWTLAIILFVVLAFTAVGLAWSSIAARAVASVSLAHLTTGFFIFGSMLLFAFTLPLVSEEVTVTNRYPDESQMTQDDYNDPNFDYSSLPCIEQQDIYTIAHTDQTAWLILINPFVVVAESAPIVNPQTYEKDGRAAPGLFANIHQTVGDARLGPTDPVPYDGCDPNAIYDDSWEERQQAAALLAPNPWIGIGASAVLLLGSLWIVVRRLRVPYKKLRQGTRVA